MMKKDEEMTRGQMIYEYILFPRNNHLLVGSNQFLLTRVPFKPENINNLEELVVAITIWHQVSRFKSIGKRPDVLPFKMRKAPFPIALILLLTAITSTLLSIYLPSLIHVVQPAAGPLHHEVKYGLYRRCVRRIPEDSLSPLLERAESNDLSIPSKGSLSRLREFSSASSSWSLGHQENVTESQGIKGPGDIDIGDDEGEGWSCAPFPNQSECRQLGQGFCILWATSGYAAQLSLFPGLVSLLTLLLITIGVGNKKTRAQRRRGGWKIVSGLMSIHSVLQIVSIAIILHVYRTDSRFSIGSHLDRAADFGVASALISIAIVIALTFVGLAAEAGQEWAGGKPPRRQRRHRRTRSGRVVVVPDTEELAEGEQVEVEVEPDEETGLLQSADRVGEDVEGGKSATGTNGVRLAS